MGEYGASCFKTLSEASRDLSKEEWDSLRFGQVCTAPSTLAEWKAAIMKLCYDTGRCDYEVKKMINNFQKKINKKVLKPSKDILEFKEWQQ